MQLVNREQINLYWNIGQRIAEKQAQEGWGKSVVQQLASDLSQTFPDAKGSSAQNLWFMRHFTSPIINPQISKSLLEKFPGATIS